MNVKQFVFLLLISSLFPFSIVNAQLIERIGSEQSAKALKITEDLKNFETSDAFESNGKIYLSLISGETINKLNIEKRRFIGNGGYLFQLDPNTLNVQHVLKLPKFVNTNLINHVALLESPEKLGYIYLSLNSSLDSFYVNYQHISHDLEFLGLPEKIFTVKAHNGLDGVHCQIARSPDRNIMAVQVSVLDKSGSTFNVFTKLFNKTLDVIGIFSNNFNTDEWSGLVKPYVNNNGFICVLSAMQTAPETYSRLKWLSSNKKQKESDIKKVYLHYFNLRTNTHSQNWLNENKYFAAWQTAQDESGNFFVAYSYTEDMNSRYLIETLTFNAVTEKTDTFLDIMVSSMSRREDFYVSMNVFTALQCLDSSLVYLFENISCTRVTTYDESKKNTVDYISRQDYWEYHSGAVFIANRYKGEYDKQYLSFYKMTFPNVFKISILNSHWGESKFYIPVLGNHEYFYFYKDRTPDTLVHKSQHDFTNIYNLVTGNGSVIRQYSTKNMQIFCGSRKSKLRFAYVKYM